MSDSYPTIQDSLSDVQKDFMGCVEMHLDPPDHHGRTYAVESTYVHPADAELPGQLLRFRLSVAEVDSDLTERCHTIEFMDAASGRPRGWVRHRMKRIEALGGRYFWTESRFEVAAPGLPDGTERAAEVEREVLAFVDKVRLLDRARQLVEQSAR